MDFIYQAQPSRVIFRAGALGALPDEVARLGTRALLLSTPEQADFACTIGKRLGERSVGVFDRATMHVPIEVAAQARDEARRLGADVCVAIGGGSTIGLGKAIALESGLPILAVPTTYAGSEMTPIWGLTEAGVKRTGRDARVLPRTVIYDPELTLSLPAAMSGASGMNAVAHCVEALYAPDANPIVSLMAEEGIRALGRGLPRIAARLDDPDARADALYGAWLAGTALGTVGMGLHHKICHTLGGSFGLPHADTHAVMIAHVARYNQGHAPDALARVARALGATDAATGLFALADAVGAPPTLADLGFTIGDIERAADIATANEYPNPRPVTREGIVDLLTRATTGLRDA